ncbi:DUF1877 family protein [Microbacterium sp. ZW T5_45]|uniref:DUF1877 family protein n=1 Tax=Microbacterium sp. ZW T5_45 TaxID=3378080 RepID=UPI0038547764
MQAAYTLIDDATLDRLLELDGADLVEALEALETGDTATVYVDKLWDGLHFLLTGALASDPIDGEPLSEAVVGVHVVDDDDYVGCTEFDELGPIIGALDGFDLNAALAGADFAEFARAGVTPSIWKDEPSQLRGELADAFALVRDAHRRAAEAERHLLVSIF